MKDYIEIRVKEVAKHIIDSKSTIRKTAKLFGVSKSTVQMDITKRLGRIDSILYKEVKSVIEQNKAESHVRGGIATKTKFKEMM